LIGKEEEGEIVWIKRKVVRNEEFWDENLIKLVNNMIDLIGYYFLIHKNVNYYYYYLYYYYQIIFKIKRTHVNIKVSHATKFIRR